MPTNREILDAHRYLVQFVEAHEDRSISGVLDEGYVRARLLEKGEALEEIEKKLSEHAESEEFRRRDFSVKIGKMFSALGEFRVRVLPGGEDCLFQSRATWAIELEVPHQRLQGGGITAYLERFDLARKVHGELSRILGL
jgi:hypothetical protein